MKVLEGYQLKSMTIKNRLVMPPMCMYSSDETGIANDFHFAHYTTRALSGIGLMIVEATGVLPNGRISDSDLGLWKDSQIPGLKRIVESVQTYGAKIAVQLNHGGRKYTGKGLPVAPSALPFDQDSKIPTELSHEGIAEIIKAFKEAAIRADKAGFDAIEIHAAHGYLLHEFLSPLSNKRTDEYGGSTQERCRLLTEVLEAVKAVWPKEKGLWVRISASDYQEGGITIEEMTKIIDIIKKYIDLVHVSSGGLVPAPIKAYPGYQVSFSDTIKKECGVPTIAVGLITNLDQAEDILQKEAADFVALGRELLRNPLWLLREASVKNLTIDYPEQYKRAFL